MFRCTMHVLMMLSCFLSDLLFDKCLCHILSVFYFVLDMPSSNRLFFTKTIFSVEAFVVYLISVVIKNQVFSEVVPMMYKVFNWIKNIVLM